MKKLLTCLTVSTLLLSSCSWKPEKEVVTVEKVITPTIAVAQKPKAIKMLDAKIIVITETNLQEVIKKVKAGIKLKFPDMNLLEIRCIDNETALAMQEKMRSRK